MYVFVISWEEQRILVCAIELFIYICTSLPIRKQKTNPPFHPDTFPFWKLLSRSVHFVKTTSLYPKIWIWDGGVVRKNIVSLSIISLQRRWISIVVAVRHYIASFAPHVCVCFFFLKHLSIVSWERRQSGSTQWIHVFCCRETRETTYSYLSKQNISNYIHTSFSTSHKIVYNNKYNEN